MRYVGVAPTLVLHRQMPTWVAHGAALRLNMLEAHVLLRRGVGQLHLAVGAQTRGGVEAHRHARARLHLYRRACKV